MTRNDTWTRRIRAIAIAGILSAGLAACHSGSSHPQASAAAGSARGAIASATANPTTAADLASAKALVKSCFAGTPLQQVHQVHLVFLSSSTGKHGPDVLKARATLRDCLGISKADETPFFNDAATAAEHGHLTTHDGRVTYFTVTLPGIVLKYSKAAPSSGPAQTPAPSTSH